MNPQMIPDLPNPNTKQQIQNYSTQPNLQDIIDRQSGASSKQSCSTKQSKQQVSQISKHQIKRVPFEAMHYYSYLFVAVMLPLLNLLILFTQSYNLSWDNNFASIQRKNFKFYYIGIVYYFASIIILFLSSAYTNISCKQILKIYILMDSNQFCGIASNVCYACLHINYLCNDVTGQSYSVYSVDIIFLTAFVLNNFAFLGHVRVSLIYYKWSIKQTLTFKILVFTSSLSYFAYGILIIIGKDTLSLLLSQANSIVQNFIQSNDFGNLTASVQTQLIQQMNQISDNITVVQNLISLFVFTSFANIFEVMQRLNDFDKSADLEPRYEIKDDQQDQQPKLQNLKAQIENRFVNINQKLNNIAILKETFDSFRPKTQKSILPLSSKHSHPAHSQEIQIQDQIPSQ